MFQLEHAAVHYNGRAALSDVSLSVREGERVALVGKSGAGKSTLLKLLFEQRRKDASFIPSDFALVRTLTVFHNVYMGRLHRHGTWYNLINLVRPMQGEIERVGRVVERLELGDKLFAPVGELSGGQQQRTAVGRALFQEAQVLLGDEPVSAVDAHQARVVLHSIADNHATVILAMHDVEMALAFTERIVGLKDGRIALDEPSASLAPTDLDFLYT